MEGVQKAESVTRSWKVNVSEDNQDLLFRAMRLECASRVIDEWIKRHTLLSLARCLTNFKTQVSVRKTHVVMEGEMRDDLKGKLKEQEKKLMNPDLEAMKLSSQTTAIKWLDKFYINNKKLSAGRLLRIWLSNLSDTGQKAGLHEEAERSALLFRKCKVALKDSDKLRRQLKVVRGVYLMVVASILKTAEIQVRAARALMVWNFETNLHLRRH